MTLTSFLALAVTRLASASDAAQLDADRLLLHVLNKKESSWLTAHGEEELTPEQQEEFERLANERATGKPLAYILGEWEFYGRMFYVTPDVLVPRPETENLIEEALKYVTPGMTVADIGTGSGVIAVTLALETRANILATDISPAALRVATKNAQRHGVEKQIEFIQEDMTISLGKRKIDLIVSNPPYLPAEALAKAGYSTDTLGLNFEPRIALDGGKDGQDFIRKIQASGIPALVETTGGGIKKLNL